MQAVVVVVLVAVLELEPWSWWLSSRQPCRLHCSAYSRHWIAVMLWPTRIVSKADGMAAAQREKEPCKSEPWSRRP